MLHQHLVPARQPWTVEWASRADLPALEAFTRHHFGAHAFQSSAGRLRWLFASHPGGLHASICRAEGRIVGFCGHLPVTLATGDETVEAAYGIDFMVAPQWRRHGIGRQLLELRLRRFPVSLSTGQSADMGRLYRKTPARLLGSFSLAYFSTRMPVRGSARSLARSALATVLARRGPRVAGKRRVIGLDEAADVAPRLGPRFGLDEVGPEVSRRGILWRYGGPVYTGARAFELTTSTGARGILFSRLAPDGTEQLLDLVAPFQVRGALLRLAGQTTPTGHLETQFCGGRLGRELAHFGFLVRPREARLVALTNLYAVDRRLSRLDAAWFAGESDVDLLRAPPM